MEVCDENIKSMRVGNALDISPMDITFGVSVQDDDPQWFKAMKSRHVAFKGDVGEFLQEYVPADNDILATIPDPGISNVEIKDVARRISKVKTSKNMCPPILELLKHTMANFGKENIFDLKVLKARDRTMYSGIGASFPGRKVSRAWTWRDISVVFEGKTSRDPVNKDGTIDKNGLNAVAQLATTARNLIYENLSCYVFVVGVYGKDCQMRIHRFDRSGVISCGFSCVERTDILRKFLWLLSNPVHNMPNTIVGSDSTISYPTIDEIRSLWPRIQRLVPAEAARGRKALARTIRKFKVQVTLPGSMALNKVLESPTIVHAFSIGKPLHQSINLFTRATYVCRVLVDHPAFQDKVLVLKDIWNEQTRMSEAEFYQRIHGRYKQLREKEPDLLWLQKYYPDTDEVPGLASFYGSLDLSAKIGASDAQILGYTTMTARLLSAKSERKRIRSLSGPVGIPWEDYSCMKQVIKALRDVSAGLLIAKHCGVLHRDVSVGNVLLYGDGGFLHDFDCATVIASCLDNEEESALAQALVPDLKKMTGTKQFMAMGVLRMGRLRVGQHEPHHDLESLYWLLIWTLLRHSHFRLSDGPEELDCTCLFDTNDDCSTALNKKRSWFSDLKFQIIDNPPLNNLLQKLFDLFIRHYFDTLECPGSTKRLFPPAYYVPVSHIEFFTALQTSLEVDDWAVDDSRYVEKHPATLRKASEGRVL